MELGSDAGAVASNALYKGNLIGTGPKSWGGLDRSCTDVIGEQHRWRGQMQGTVAESGARPVYVQICVPNDVRLGPHGAGCVYGENDIIATTRCSGGAERPLCRVHARSNSGSTERGAPVPCKRGRMLPLVPFIFIGVFISVFISISMSTSITIRARMLIALEMLESEARIGDGFVPRVEGTPSRSFTKGPWIGEHNVMVSPVFGEASSFPLREGRVRCKRSNHDNARDSED